MNRKDYSFSDQFRHHLKRVRAISHQIRGGATISVSGHTIKVQTETPLQTEHTRYNAMTERQVTTKLLNHVDKKTVLDIGAGHGVEVCLAAKAGAAQVTAVEADPERAEFVCTNAKKNGVEDIIDVKVLQVGVGDEDTTCIDSLDIQPDILKVDIEGQEWAALEGASDTLTNVEYAFIETHPQDLPNGKTVKDLCKQLTTADLIVESKMVRSQPYLLARRGGPSQKR